MLVRSDTRIQKFRESTWKVGLLFCWPLLTKFTISFPSLHHFISILLITFKIIHGLCLAYLSSLLQQYHPQRSLRSSSKLLFTVPTVNSVTYGERAFSFSSPILWNSLPGSVKNTTSLSSFKSALKTFLFRKFYF